MANPHSTPDLHAAKTERTIIVGYRPQGANKNTPSLTCKYPSFSSTHFLRIPVFQPSAGTLPASGCSGIREGARCYIPLASVR